MSGTRLLVFVFAGFFFSSSAAWSDSKAPAVTVVFWNLLNYFSNETSLTQETTEKAVETRMLAATVLAELQPDVLGILEIGPGNELAEFQAFLKERGVDLPHAILAGGADPLRRTAILSRFPLPKNHSRDHVTFELGGSHLAMQRGILDVELRLPGIGDVRCIGVHLKSKRESPEFDEAEFRARELRELTRHIREIFTSNSEAKILLWGDFNATKQEAPLRRLSGIRNTPDYLHRMELQDERGDRWTHHWRDADLYSRIDFFFVSSALLPHVDETKSGIASPPDWSQVSDHRPLKLVLKTP